MSTSSYIQIIRFQPTRRIRVYKILSVELYSWLLEY